MSNISSAGADPSAAGGDPAAGGGAGGAAGGAGGGGGGAAAPDPQASPEAIKSGAASAQASLLSTLWGNYFSAMKDSAGKLRI